MVTLGGVTLTNVTLPSFKLANVVSSLSKLMDVIFTGATLTGGDETEIVAVEDGVLLESFVTLSLFDDACFNWFFALFTSSADTP